jgi:hypothetical protein
LLPAQVILEAPDLGGKTSLFHEVHKRTRYCWNIHDRSWLTMFLYGKFYGRPMDDLERGLLGELSYLNNSVVVLLPSWEVIVRRFRERGDEIQDEKSLKTIHELYSDHDWIGKLPNVLFLRSSDASVADNASVVISWIQARQNRTLDSLADEVSTFAREMRVSPAGKSNDAFRFDFEISLDVSSTLNAVDRELVDYHRDLGSLFFQRVENEIFGLNRHREMQDCRSRRFIVSSNSRISLVHLVFRDDSLDFHVTFRSVVPGAPLKDDLNFLTDLAKRTVKQFSMFRDARVARFFVNVHSTYLTW